MSEMSFSYHRVGLQKRRGVRIYMTNITQMRSAAPLEESAVTHTPGTNAIKGCGGEYDDLEVTENQKMIKKGRILNVILGT